MVKGWYELSPALRRTIIAKMREGREMYDCDITMDSQVTEEDMRDQKIDDIINEVRAIFGLGWRAGYEVGYADGYPAGMDQVVAQFGIDEAEVF